MKSSESDSPDIWVVIDDRVGIKVQAIGLAEALGRSFEIKSLIPRAPWTLVPISLPRPMAHLEAAGLSAPFPKLVIGAGRRMVPYLRRLRQGGSRIVFLGDPTVNPRQFDLIVAPIHDRMKGSNIVETLGSMHRVTEQRLAESRAEFAGAFDGLPHPKVGVLIGGASNHHNLPIATARDFAEKLSALRDAGAGLMITPSRRTPPAALAALRTRLDGPGVRIWDGNGPNPYFGILAHADLLVVTDDSVNMASEACATGKPVLTYPLPGRSRRISRFHRDLARLGHTRPFTGVLDRFEAPRLDEMGKVVARVEELLLAAGPKTPYL